MIGQKQTPDEILLTPIRLRAYLHGQDYPDPIYSAFGYDFSELGNPDSSIDSGLFQIRKGEDAGVHLHWSLPEGLTSGVQRRMGPGGKPTEGGDPETEDPFSENHALEYPIVPNRWLVARLWTVAGCSKVQVKTFLVESDALQKERGSDTYNRRSPCWPHPDDPDTPYRYLGRAYPADISPGELPVVARQRLTAISPMDPFFSGYYPHCRNVFGFYDDLPAEGLENARLSYLVCGWYEDAAEPEPILAIRSVGQLEEQLLLKVKGERLPRRMVCSGMLGGIEWKTKQVHYPTGIPDKAEPGQVAVKPVFALGDNSADALAALAGHGEPAKERVFRLFMQNLLPSVTDGPNLAKAEQSLHGAGFSVLDPPKLAAIKRKDPQAAQPPSRAAMNALSHLRQRQREQFDRYHRIRQLQRAAYESWNLYILSEKKRYKQKHWETLHAALEQSVSAIRAWKADQTALEDELERLDLGTDYELTTEPDGNFYMPTDPVLVVKQLANTEAKADRSALNCRRAADIVSSVTFTGLQGGPVSLDGGRLRPPCPIPAPFPDVLSALLDEALLLSAGFSRFLAEQAFLSVGMAPSEEELGYWSRLVEDAQESGKASGKAGSVTYDKRTAMEPARQRYRPQWYPLFLEWEAYYYPDLPLHGETPDLRNWAYEDGTFRYTGDHGIFRSGKVLQGRIHISDNAAKQFDAMTERYLPNTRSLREDARKDHLLSQSIGGLNDFLMMRSLFDPQPLFSGEEGMEPILESFRRMIPDVLGSRPLYDSVFAPIRAGFFAFGRLRVLDMLGRFQHIDSPDLYLSECMRAPGAPAVPHEAMLQPRFTQPSRLHVKWVCGEKGRDGIEAGFVETASPLCGFLLPNRLDYSLMAYSAQGDPLGSLNLTQVGGGVSWKGPPGVGEALESEIPPGLNPTLYAFLAALKRSGRQALIDLTEYINKMQYEITPSPHQSSSIEFIGRPIALARASVKLQQLGAFEAYRHNEEFGDKPDVTHAANVAKAVFPLELGKRYDCRDGTIGFFLNGSYGQMQVYADGAGKGNYLLPGNRIAASMDPRLEPDLVSVLLDPWAELTVTSGVLPVCSLRLPEELVSAALQKIQATYFTAQLLIHQERLSIPIPHRNDREYWFIQRRGDAAWDSTLVRDTDPQAFLSPYPHKAVEGYIQIRKKEG